MRRRGLLPTIGCLCASGLTLLACNLFGIGFSAFAQETKSSAAPQTVHASIRPSGVALPRKIVAPEVSPLTRPRVVRRHQPAHTLVAGSSHVENVNDDIKAAPTLPPTKPTRPVAPTAVAQPSAPVATAAPVLEVLPIAAAPPSELPIPVPAVPAVVEELLP
jgi:hypothetical protein